MEFSTFFGGEFGEQGNGIALDSEGNIYVVGQTRDVPAAPGSFSAVTGSTFDVFVLKLDPTGTQMLYQAVFGGSARERGTAIAVDASGAAYVTGWTFSEDFPVTPNAAQTAFGGGTRDAFVAKLSLDGSQLEYATYLGGSTFEDGNGITVDASGVAWAVGTSGSVDFPATPNALKATQGVDQRSAFIVAVSADGSAFEYASLLGGSGRDQANAVALGDPGELWVAGNTGSTDFPVTAGAFQAELAGVDDAFIVRLRIVGDPTISAATLYGGAVCVNPLAGSPCDLANAVYPDAGGVFVAGNSLSADLPLGRNAAQSAFGGGVAFGDAFVASFDSGLKTLQAATFLGGSSEDQANGVVTDRAGDVFVIGTTGSPNFQTTPDALQPTFGDLDEAFLARLDPALSEIGYASWLGGTGGDRGYAIAADGEGNVVVSGETASLEFPATPGTVKPDITLVRAEGGDAFIARFTFDLLPRFSSSSVVNAASFEAGLVAPGEIVSVFARGLTGNEVGSLTIGPEGRVTSELVGVRLLINGTPSALTFVGRDQVNAVVSYSADALPVARIQLERNGVATDPVTLRTAATSPALFALGGEQAAALNEDGTVNTPGNPAAAGSVVVLFGTGEGQTDPPGVDGAVTGVDILPRPVLPVTARVGDVGAQVLYAGGAPGLVAGVVQLNVVIPATVIGGPTVPVSFTAGQRRSPAGVTIAVR